MKSEQARWVVIARFVLVLMLLNAFYFYFYQPRAWFLPTSPLHGGMVHLILSMVSKTTVFVLNLLGFGAELSADLKFIYLFDSPITIEIRNFCLGIDVMFVFLSLVVSYPGRWQTLAWFLPLGLLVIQLINVMRVLAMCLWNIYQPPFWVDNHDLFNVVAAVFVFLMFTLWVRLSRRTAA